MSDKLKNSRNRIDEIDTQMAQLFKERMETAMEIARIKSENKIPILNQGRENEVLHKVSDEVGETFEEYARVLWSTMMDLSRSYQNTCLGRTSNLADRVKKALEDTNNEFPRKATVACQGTHGANSEAACNRLFAFPKISFMNSFESVFAAVESGLCQYGILPIENSSFGSVNAVYDHMKEHDFYIVRSIRVRIAHQLMVKPGTKMEDVKEIFSHEQALGQCKEFLKGLKGVKATACANTAEAARMVSESDRTDIAAIASKEASELYGLEIINSNIQISDNNFTRFICISKKMEIYPGANRVSLMLSLPHEAGSLYHMIARFSALGLNLTKLESRPIPGSDFEFMFYFDLDASVYSERLVSLLAELEARPELFVFLGAYSEVI